MRKLVACLACRNQGTRLYGKPLQNLDIPNNVYILKYILDALKGLKAIDEISLAISEGVDNLGYKEICEQEKISCVVGDEIDVLGRLINACINSEGTDIFRVTTESPFIAHEYVLSAWDQHVHEDNDLTVARDLPDGAGFEIIKLEAYQSAWIKGGVKYRNEYCSQYIYENQSQFKIKAIAIQENLKRPDLRVTVDYPEDLIVCRAIYNKYRDLVPYIPINKIIDFLDSREDLRGLVSRFVV